VDDLGDVYVTGVDGVGWVTIKYNLAGEEEWISYHAQGAPTAHGIGVDNAGNAYVTGGDSDYLTIKYDSSGQEQWVGRYNGPGNADDQATAIAIDGSGNVYVTGSSDLPGAYYDYATVKYNSAGQEQWVSTYGEPGGLGGATAIALDDSSNAYVTGQISHPGMYSDYGTIKYNSAGQQQWVARYNGPPENAVDVATAIVVDGSGNIYVTGRSQRTSFFSDYDYVTIKYNSAGQEQWLARYDGLGNANDEAVAIAIGGPGNVYVTGRSGVFSYDYTTVKYGQGPTPTPTAPATASPTPTSTATPTATATASPTPTAMCSPTPTATASPTPTPSEPPPMTPTPTPTATATSTVTPPPTPSPTGTETPTPTPTAEPCSVTSASCGNTVFVPPTDFSINLSDAVDPATVNASDFTVNGTPADNAVVLNGNMTIEFVFNTSPAMPGLNTMHIPAGAFNCLQAGVHEFTCTFRYTTTRLSPTPRPRPTARPRP
jgi:beta-propeller repeat-containing protein